MLPGLNERVQFLAWKHRLTSPVVVVQTPSISADTTPRIVTIPRVQWDDVTCAEVMVNDEFVMAARAYHSRSDFKIDELFVAYMTHAGSITRGEMITQLFPPHMHMLHNSVLTMMTADDFATEICRRRKDLQKGSAAEQYVRMTGLRGAAHLNGREGAITGEDPNSLGRIIVRLEEGTTISARTQNCEPVQRPKLFNQEF
jgi:hypothetical protein